MDQKAKDIMENLRLAAWARLSAAFGPPIAIAVMLAVGAMLINGQRDAAVQAAEQARIAATVAELEVYRREAFARGQAYQRDLAAVSDTLKAMREDFRREVDRLAARIDQQRAPTRN